MPVREAMILAAEMSYWWTVLGMVNAESENSGPEGPPTRGDICMMI